MTHSPYHKRIIILKVDALFFVTEALWSGEVECMCVLGGWRCTVFPCAPFLSRCERGNSDGVDKEGEENVKILLTDELLHVWLFKAALYSPTLTELSYQLPALSWLLYLHTGSKNEMVTILNVISIHTFSYICFSAVFACVVKPQCACRTLVTVKTGD